MRRSVVIAGVGGQGLLTIGSVLGEALLRRGFNVNVGEVHGLSQRGGSVVVFVKYGSGTVSPIVTTGEADLLVGLELIETSRRLPLVKKDGVVVANNFLLPPPASGSVPSREELAESITRRFRAYLLDATWLARKAGSEVALNMVMVGAALATGVVDAELEDIEAVLAERFKGAALKTNIEAVRLGYEEVKNRAKQI